MLHAISKRVGVGAARRDWAYGVWIDGGITLRHRISLAHILNTIWYIQDDPRL